MEVRPSCTRRALVLVSVRPDRSMATSTTAGPGCGDARYCRVIERGCRAGSPTTAAIALSTTAAMYPPWSPAGAVHVASRSTAIRPSPSSCTAMARSKAPSSTAGPASRREKLASRTVGSLLELPPDGDGGLVHRQRDRRLGLGRLDHHRVHVEVVQQPVGDRRGQALERPVGALLRDERRQLADLAVVDGVGDVVGRRRVVAEHVERDVEHEALADLALGFADAVVRVEREAADLDRDRGVGDVVVLVLRVLDGLLVYVVVDVVDVVVAPFHWPRNVAAATSSAWATAATSWTRNTSAPLPSAMTFVAIVPGTRPSLSSPLILPMKPLRDVPTTIGRPIATSSSSRPSSARLWSTVLPNPIPGSSQTLSSAMPAATACSRRSVRKALMSSTTSS